MTPTSSPSSPTEPAPPTNDRPDDDGELLVELGQRWTTLGELGQVLPLAVGTDRSFSFREMTLALRRQVAQGCAPLRGKESSTGLASHALALSLQTLQGVDLTRLKPEEAALLVRMLPWSSVICLVSAMQVEQAGDDRLELRDVRCPVCRHLHRQLTVCLSEMRVRVYGDLGELPEIEVELERGLSYPSGKTSRWVRLRPARWDALASLADDELENQAIVTTALLASAICGLDTVEGEFSPSREIVERLHSRDADLLDREHALLAGGPTMVVPARCGEHTFHVPYDWRRASFFGSAAATSRSSTRRLRRR